jgi:hypothetical protein
MKKTEDKETWENLKIEMQRYVDLHRKSLTDTSDVLYLVIEFLLLKIAMLQNTTIDTETKKVIHRKHINRSTLRASRRRRFYYEGIDYLSREY